MGDPEKKITDEEAGEALRALVSGAPETEEEPVVVRKGVLAEEPKEEPAPEPTPAAPAEEAPAAPEQEEPPKPEEPQDDVVSLRKRLDEEKALYDARWKAMQERSATNERILRERYLRKSTAADKALKTLRAAKSVEGGIPVEEVDRAIQDIEATMNPASTQYVPPQPVAEDQSMVINEFLNEKGMTTKDAEEFGNWVKGDGATVLSPREMELGQRDLDGFLRLAYLRYNQIQEKPKTTRDEAVEAVRSVQRTQREAARAATASPAAPRKSPVAQQGVDVKKLTQDDISTLLRQSVEQNR